MAVQATLSPSTTRTKLNSNQIKGFWAAWGGWCLDGMDAFIYSLVLVPALTELLPKSGIQATPGNIGFYGSILFALFLAGWGMSMVWGPIADRFGRVKALMMTILMYSVFTLACGLAQTIWQSDLPIFPLLLRPITTATSTRLTGFRPTPALAGETWNIEQWDITPAS